MKSLIKYLTFGMCVLFAISTYAQESGRIGDSVYYNYTPGGLLTISGTGPMYNYHSTYDEERPISFRYTETELPCYVKKIVIEEGVTTVGDYMFCQFHKTQSIELPSTLISIGVSSFAGCIELTDVKFPKSIVTIKQYAFSKSFFQDALPLKVEVQWTTPPTFDLSIFYQTPLKTLYVPEGCVEAYKNADIWKDFEQIVTATDIKGGALINDDSTKDIYRLDGTKVSGEQESLVPGTYIVQGEKVLIK